LASTQLKQKRAAVTAVEVVLSEIK